MKILESSTYTVQVYATRRVIYRGSRARCIRFIQRFDRASPDYIDMRLYDDRNKEDLWHGH